MCVICSTKFWGNSGGVVGFRKTISSSMVVFFWNFIMMINTENINHKTECGLLTVAGGFGDDCASVPSSPSTGTIAISSAFSVGPVD